MARYNHFSEHKYLPVNFHDLSEGTKFRMDKWKGKIRRMDIIMVKISETSYMEWKSKVVYSVTNTYFTVRCYE